MGGPMHIGDVCRTDNRYSCKVSITLNKGNKKPTTQLVCVTSLTWQHVLTSKGHLQTIAIKYMKENVHNSNYV